MYTPGEDHWGIYCRRECSEEDEMDRPSCGVLTHNFYIGAEGMVCPCMGMADCTYAKNFPNLTETPLKDILSSQSFHKLVHAKVGEVRDGSGKCRDCKYIDRCTGGCRNSALLAGNNYYGVDPDLCWFFEHDGQARITAAAQGPFEEYIKRNPPREWPEKKIETDVTECP